MSTQIAETGFLILEDVLSTGECDKVLRALQTSAVTRGRAGARHLMTHPAVNCLAADPRLLAIAGRELGPAAVPYRATLFEKSGRANWRVVWHQDKALPVRARIESAEWGPWSTKAGVLYAHAPAWALNRIVAIRVHLDASTGENGPLLVIGGSHQLGVLTDEDVIAYASRHAGSECVVGRGGILAMRPLLIHASSKSLTDAPRRVLHIEYANGLDLGYGAYLAVA